MITHNIKIILNLSPTDINIYQTNCNLPNDKSTKIKFSYA